MHYMTTLNRVFVLEENGTCMKHQTTSKNQFLKKFRKKKRSSNHNHKSFMKVYLKSTSKVF